MKSATSFNLLRGLACAALALAGPSLFSLDSGDAWKSAVAMSAVSKTVYPGQVSFETIEYGKKGEILSREQTTSRINYDQEGKTSTEILQATKDGKDVTEEKRAELKKNEKKAKEKKGGKETSSMGGFGIPDPFDPPSGAKLTIGEAVSTSEGGTAYWDFSFVYEKKGEMASKGIVRLDASSGRPVSMKYGLKNPPLGVKYAEFVVLYAPFGEASFITERMDIGFDAQILLVRKKMDMKVALSDYQDRGRVYED